MRSTGVWWNVGLVEIVFVPRRDDLYGIGNDTDTPHFGASQRRRAVNARTAVSREFHLGSSGLCPSMKGFGSLSLGVTGASLLGLRRCSGHVMPSLNFHSKTVLSPPSVMMTRVVIPVRAATEVQ